jgi:hypothetical protein
VNAVTALSYAKERKFLYRMRMRRSGVEYIVAIGALFGAFVDLSVVDGVSVYLTSLRADCLISAMHSLAMNCRLK